MGIEHGLHRPGDSPVHRAAPEVKVVAALVVVLCIVATPRQAFWAFGGYLMLLLAIAAVAAVPVRWVTGKLFIEVPFVLFALLMPFTAGGELVVVMGVPLSVEGLLSAWNIVVKATLGLVTSLLLAATTAPHELLVGLQRLRVPATLITITSLMLRYATVLVGEVKRMRLARIARGHDPRFLWQAKATAGGIGSLFIRSYERGERVHLAMLSRGWTGALPECSGQRAALGPRAGVWALGLCPVACAAVLLGVALWTT